MSESSIPEGTGPLKMADAIESLLNTQAPAEASESSQEPPAEAVEAEATEVEEVEVEAVEEDQAETEADETEEYETEAEAEEVEYYTVKVDGEEMDVTADDLIKSYQLESTAQKRLSDAAEQRKTLEADRTALEQERERYAQGLAALEAQLTQTNEPTQEYWDKLYEEDPLEFVKQREAMRDREKAMQTVQEERRQLIQQHAAQEQVKLLDRIPEWRDPEVANREKAGLIKFAQRMGFTDNELSQVVDSRLVDVLRRAHLYDILQSEKPAAKKKVAKAPKMVKGGKPKTKQDVASEKKRKAFDRLKKTGSKEAAVDFLLNR